MSGSHGLAVAAKDAPTIASQHDSMVSMLERVLMNPDVPVERLERLLELQDRERTRRAKEDFSHAMAGAQKQMRAVLVDKANSQTRSKYASYAALDAVVRPIYTAHGFSVTFNTESVAERPEVLRIVAFVETAGFERRYEIEMPCDGKGAKGSDVMTRTHAVKSAVSYGKSTLLPMIFNIAVTDKADDDGNAATASEKLVITAEQVAALRKALTFRDIPEERACKRFKVEALADIYQVDFDACMKIAQTAGGAK